MNTDLDRDDVAWVRTLVAAYRELAARAADAGVEPVDPDADLTMLCAAERTADACGYILDQQQDTDLELPTGAEVDARARAAGFEDGIPF